MPDFIGGPIARRKKGVTKYIVMWKAPILDDGSVSPDRILVFPGGMEHPAEHGDLEVTYRQELTEETGLILREGAEIKRLPVTAEHEGHTKHFVMAWRRDSDGSLRRGPMRDGKTWLSQPSYADKAFLEEYLHGDYRLVLPFLE